MEGWAGVLLLLGLVAAASASALLLQWNRPSSQRLPPGPRPLPVLGNLLLFAGSKCWHRDFSRLAEQYGPIMWLRLGSQGAVMVQSKELAMEILKHQDAIFSSRPPPSSPSVCSPTMEQTWHSHPPVRTGVSCASC